MRKALKKYHKNMAAIVIILALSGIIILSHMAGFLDRGEFGSYDLRINLDAHFPRQRSHDIYMVLIDDESIEWAQRERGWGWPWPRQAYAEFLDYLNIGNPKAVVFDIIFSEPSIYRHYRQDEILDDVRRRLNELEGVEVTVEGGPQRGLTPVRRDIFREIEISLQDLGPGQDDAAFALAAKNFESVVQGVQLSNRSGWVETWPEDLNKPLFNLNNFDLIISKFGVGDEGILNSALFPIEELRNSAAVIGSFTGLHDADNVIRRQRLFTLFDGKAIPGLAAAALMATGRDKNIFYDAQNMQIRWGDLSIPVDNEGMSLLRFRGIPQDIYLSKSMSAVLQSAEDHAAGRTPLLPPGHFDDYYVFVGVYGQGLFDIFPTPIAARYPGMAVHITMLDNMLMGDFIQKAHDWIAVLLIIGAVALVVILVLFSGKIVVSVTGLIVSFAGIIIAGVWVFHLGWWIPMVAPLVATVLAFITATLYNFATEGKDKRFIKNAFSRILSPKVIDQIIADPSHLKLGGDRRKMTAIFTDVQRFSTIASELQDQYGENGPTVLVNLLNLYLTEMSNIVLENGGTIDKYEGDAIIAFFGAPVWMENHAAQACRSAILMKKREKEIVETIMNPDGEFHAPLARLIEKKAVPKERPLFTRLGINTGDMVVGFMGTPSKMDYTIMGNAVNLAARLEGVNKQYDTHGILISEYTKGEIGDEFITRPLSRVTVVGIPVPLRLYELLTFKEDASPEMLIMLEVWEGALKAFENRNFEEAKNAFAAVYQRNPEDLTAKLYLSRSEKNIVTPPPAIWDGVDNLSEK